MSVASCSTSSTVNATAPSVPMATTGQRITVSASQMSKCDTAVVREVIHGFTHNPDVIGCTVTDLRRRRSRCEEDDQGKAEKTRNSSTSQQRIIVANEEQEEENSGDGDDDGGVDKHLSPQECQALLALLGR